MGEASRLSVRRELVPVATRSRSDYARRVNGEGQSRPWWTAVIITAGSARQAERYEAEVQRRLESGRVPEGVHYLTVPDPGGVRIGSGGATLNALAAMAQSGFMPTAPAALADWWRTQRIFIIHSGGDSRRLPEYSLSGKLFSALPVRTPWGDVSTVFDEMLAFSTAWASRLASGLLVASGDVVLSFDPTQLDWSRPGVCGVAMRETVARGSAHGVFVTDDTHRVYSFLQKPTADQVQAAGGLLPGERVALDTGLFRFDAATASGLSGLSEAWRRDQPAAGDAPPAAPPSQWEIDIYQHFAGALTGEWAPPAHAPRILHQLAETLTDVPFWCDIVDGEFTHIGTTELFRRLMTEESGLSQLYDTQQRLGAVAPAGVRSAGVIVDSVLAPDTELGPRSLAIECELDRPLRVGPGAILHGVTSDIGLTEAPEDSVVHQVPVIGSDGVKGTVVRVYGVPDDPKVSLVSGRATWFGRPLLESLATLGMDPEMVWPGIPLPERSLWNASLFPVGTPGEAGLCAAWMLGQTDDEPAALWASLERMSLASSTAHADDAELAALLARRRQLQWQYSTLALVESGNDLRPLIVSAPSPAALAAVGRLLLDRGTAIGEEAPTGAASTIYQASCFLAGAGLATEAEQARTQAFTYVQRAVAAGVSTTLRVQGDARWQHDRVEVSAPARIDLGGGWSDTPPFCIDWGGTVLNVALALNGAYPIMTSVERLDDPIIRCVAGEDNQVAVFDSTEEVLAPLGPGCPFSIPRAVLQMLGVASADEALEDALTRLGGGLEIRTNVCLPMGSGLGTSSILGATALRAMTEMLGMPLPDHDLSDQVMCLEQQMTTGGGWQDQAGGIFPGAKLVRTGPGVRQRLRVEPLAWTAEREEEFSQRLVLYYTGFQRVAKDLLAQVVGSYLARETHTVQVLHSIKTLAEEMRFAMQEGDWRHLGDLLDRHWQLNVQMGRRMANAPVNAILHATRPFLVGAKPAGAGGGGFLIMLTEDPDAAEALRRHLAQADLPGQVYTHAIAREGLRVAVS